MTCTREHEVLALGTEWSSRTEEAELRAHLDSCPSCAALCADLRTARKEASKRPIAPLEARERAAMWANIEYAKRASPGGLRALWWAPAVSAALAAAFVAGAWWARHGDPSSSGVEAALPAVAETAVRVLELPAGGTLVLGSVEVRGLKAARLEVLSPPDAEPLLAVREGEISVDLLPEQSLAVKTPLTRIQAVGAAFRVDAEDGRTSVAVARGVARVGSNEAVHEIGAGESMVVESPRPGTGGHPVSWRTGRPGATEGSVRPAESEDEGRLKRRIAEAMSGPDGAGEGESGSEGREAGGGGRRSGKHRRAGRVRSERALAEAGAEGGSEGVAAGADVGVARGAAGGAGAGAGADVAGARGAIGATGGDVGGAHRATGGAGAGAGADVAGARGAIGATGADVGGAHQATGGAGAIPATEMPWPRPEARLETPAHAEARPTSAASLLAKADALRRAHRLDEAARAYRRVAAHPEGASLAEESLLRAALALAELDRSQEAVDVLGDARDRFGAGELSPERTALEVKLLLRLGRASDAAARLLDAADPAHESVELRTRRIEVAEALLETAPNTAHVLIAPVLEAGAPAGLIHRARSIESRIRQRTDAQKR